MYLLFNLFERKCEGSYASACKFVKHSNNITEWFKNTTLFIRIRLINYYNSLIKLTKYRQFFTSFQSFGLNICFKILGPLSVHVLHEIRTLRLIKEFYMK